MSRRDGFLRAMPVVVAYFSIAFAYGAGARASGLSFTVTTLMSLIVYAGSAQMIAVGLFTSGVPGASIALTIFLLNLRGLVLAMSLAPKVRDWPRRLRLLFALEVTDETFALHSAPEAGKRLDPETALAINHACHLSWFAGSVAGYLAGSVLPDTGRLGLDYALAAMFVGLLLPRVQNSAGALAALIAGAISLWFHAIGYGSWAALVATIVTATLITLGGRACRNRKSS